MSLKVKIQVLLFLVEPLVHEEGYQAPRVNSPLSGEFPKMGVLSSNKIVSKIVP